MSETLNIDTFYYHHNSFLGFFSWFFLCYIVSFVCMTFWGRFLNYDNIISNIIIDPEKFDEEFEASNLKIT